MNHQLKRQLHTFGTWCGVLYVLAIIGGWGLIAGLILPPQSPSAPVQEIVRYYHDNLLNIRIGMLIVMFAALLAIPFTAAVAQNIMKVEEGPGFLTLSALLGGAGLMVLTFYPATFWLVAAYRPDRAADLIYLLNDLSWLQFIGGVSMFLGLPLALAVATLGDARPNPTFPRWFGYYNVFSVVLILPDQLLFFFQGGPFAWNGVFGLWIPAVSFGSWFLVTAYCLRNHAATEVAGGAVRVEPRSAAHGA